VAVLDYRSSREINNIRTMLEKAGKKGKMTPEKWKRTADIYRSLTVYEDGSCKLHKVSSSSLIKRMRRTYQ